MEGNLKNNHRGIIKPKNDKKLEVKLNSYISEIECNMSYTVGTPPLPPMLGIDIRFCVDISHMSK